ncbi:MAG: helicase-related protein [Spirochaetales bacterium]|jgi:superfamily II DNA or RNA helicase|nr:helicase-related protein [Spirochaetales bacterium]
MASEWQYSTIHNSPCKIIEEQTLWSQTTYRIWLPSSNAVVKVPQTSIKPFSAAQQPEIQSDKIVYIATAAKVAEVLEATSSDNGQVLLAPIESNVIPLPHQIHALSRAISSDRVRYLLADEVGLGKTIEAGLVIRELKLRGLVRRVLIIAPKGLATQWMAEMQTHFNEQFQLVLPSDFKTLNRLEPVIAANKSSHFQANNPWTFFDQVIAPLDSVKPLEKRRGWNDEQVAKYNQDRFENLITAGWDLVIVDEAHRLGGSTDQVARFKLGQGLAEAAPYLLLLSATPHQGKSDAFHRIMTLVDEESFPDEASISREKVAPYVIRTEKRKSIDADGNPLFKPRKTEMVPVCWEDRHFEQELLYEAVTDYVREGYNQAIKDKQHHFGFLMILMQRLVVSSTRAIRTTLERRLAALQADKDIVSQRLDDISLKETADIYDMDGEELLGKILQTNVRALQNESSHVETLLAAAIKSEEEGADAKAEALIDWIYTLQAEEKEPDLKILLFTEFIPTQNMLRDFLEERSISVVCLNGSMSMDEREIAQNTFRDKARVLISTDAGGEGLNLQFCHVIINYDMPWNPMRIEQRIGRVDRIGQPKTVRAINFVFENSVEFRVREVLEQKLAIIYEEFGIDKTGDVLDSAQAGEIFEDVFMDAFLDPNSVEQAVEQTVSRIRSGILEVREKSAIYGLSEDLDVHDAALLRSHPLPHWVEKMTTSYLNSHGGKAIQKKYWWELHWPDGDILSKQVFQSTDAEKYSGTTLVNLENNRVRGLTLNLPQIAKGQPFPQVHIADLPPWVSGHWGLFEIRLQVDNTVASRSLRIPLLRRKFLPVFMSDEGKIFASTARHIWDSIYSAALCLAEQEEGSAADSVYDDLLAVAEESGEELYASLRAEHLEAIEKEIERGDYFFSVRRKAIERVGLAEVRNYRMVNLEKEVDSWQQELEIAKQHIGGIKPLLILRVKGETP